MKNDISGLDTAQQLLVKLVDENPDDWAIRKKVVNVLFDSSFYVDASKMLWSAPEIPPVAEELVFALKIVSKGQPSRAIRLIDVMIAQNLAEPEENLNVAKLLMVKGMSHQAIRFYGAATAIDPSLADNDFELSLLNADLNVENWSKFIQKEDFPWDSSDLVSEELEVQEEEKEEFADLLSGATMPVPLKAVPAQKTPIPKTDVATGPMTVALKEYDELESEEVEGEDVAGAKLRVVPTQHPLVESESVVEEVESSSELEPQEEKFFKKAEPEEVTPVVAPEPVLATVEDVQAAVTKLESASPSMEQKPQLPDFSDDDVSEIPAIKPSGKSKGGVLSALLGKFRGKSKQVEEEVRVDVSALDLSGVEKINPVGKVQMPDPTSANPLIKRSVPKPIGTAPPEPTSPLMTSSAIASKIERPVVDENAGPDELDGRTQLVALAPEHGGVFFSELIDKYIALEDGPLPQTAVLARDMANVDYLDLINKACRKDLGAFSQLLGLHRVMSEADCRDWVDDMNRLRKGYGDAVLATVVSKYSVSECKEILNSVYSFPASNQSAAG